MGRMHNDPRPEWNAIAACDAHMHLYRGRSFAWNLQMMRGYMEWFGLERAALMALPAMTEIPWWRDDGSNLRCLGVKAALNAENPAPVKAAMAMMGLAEEAYRLPICELLPDNRAKLEKTLRDLGLVR